MSKYKCNKCGQESEMIPKEHGFIENAYNTEGKSVGHKKCTGTFVKGGLDE